MKKLAYFITALFAVVFTGCSSLHEIEVPGQGSDRTSIYSYDGNFCIQVPDGWETAEKGEMNAEADLEVLQEEDGCYMIALLEEKANFNTDFAGFSEYVASNAQEAYDVSLSEPSIVQIDGHAADFYEFSVDMDVFRLHMLLYTVETEHFYGQIYAWTYADSYDAQAAQLQSVAMSLTEIEA